MCQCEKEDIEVLSNCGAYPFWLSANRMNQAIKTALIISVLSFALSSFGMGEAYLVKEKAVAFENKTIKVPQVYSVIQGDTTNMKEVNEKIIERFNLIPNAPANREDFEDFVGSLQFFEDQAGYLDIIYTHTLRDNFLEIAIEGDYAEFEGNPLFEIFQTYKKETFYVDLINSEVFDAIGYESAIKLRNYFEPEDYLKLLCATWVPKIREVKKRYPDDK